MDHDICWWGMSGMCGWPSTMQDVHLYQTIDLPNQDKGILLGIFDGHNGARVA